MRRIKTVTLEGTPQERELAHGRMLKGLIRELVQLWKADLAERYKMDADAFIKKFVKQTDYVVPIKKWTPDVPQIPSGSLISSGSFLLASGELLADKTRQCNSHTT